MVTPLPQHSPGLPMKPLPICLPVLAMALTACAPVYYDSDPGYPGYEGVPPGHLPPPGTCRIWYPRRPPGQQPPPGSCDELRYRVPPGARLIVG